MDRNPITVTRRDFVRGAVSAAVGAVTIGSGPVNGAPRPPRSARVVVVRDPSVLGDDLRVSAAVLKRMLADTLTHVTGQKAPKDAWLSLVRPQDIIGLVPTSHLNPTRKELVSVVEESLVEAGIPRDRIRMAQGGPDQPKACTALIALPALKAHWLTGLGTVLKNYIEYSGKPSAYHDENNAKLGEIWNLPFVKGKTKLVVIDALRPLCDKGPQPDPRYLWPYKGLIAGTDPVALDAISLRVITQKRQALRREPWPLQPPPLCVAAADEQYNLGTSRLEEIKVDPVGWTQDLLI